MIGLGEKARPQQLTLTSPLLFSPPPTQYNTTCLSLSACVSPSLQRLSPVSHLALSVKIAQLCTASPSPLPASSPSISSFSLTLSAPFFFRTSSLVLLFFSIFILFFFGSRQITDVYFISPAPHILLSSPLSLFFPPFHLLSFSLRPLTHRAIKCIPHGFIARHAVRDGSNKNLSHDLCRCEWAILIRGTSDVS